MRRIYDPFEEFERMRQEMERMMNSMFKQGIVDAQNLEKLAQDPNTRVYGITVRMGPDGKPIVREFGNIKPTLADPSNPEKPSLTTEERELLVDVIPKEREVVVIAELPGVEKGEINLELTSKALTLSVDNPKRRYHRVVGLPCAVDQKGALASYRNGVLEVTLKRVGSPEEQGRPIHVK